MKLLPEDLCIEIEKAIQQQNVKIWDIYIKKRIKVQRMPRETMKDSVLMLLEKNQKSMFQWQALDTHFKVMDQKNANIYYYSVISSDFFFIRCKTLEVFTKIQKK